MALLKLLGLCLSMFVGAYVCGEIPLRCSLSQRSLKYVTTVGVGLLIGVSFIVIIPEGVHTYYGAKPVATVQRAATNTNSTTTTMLSATGAVHGAHDHSHEPNNFGRAQAHLADEEPYLEADALGVPIENIKPHVHADAAAATKPTTATTTATITAPAADASAAAAAAAAVDDHDHESSEEDSVLAHSAEEEGEEGGDSHSSHAHSHEECVDLSRSSTSVGAALVLGFVVMLLVDRIGGGEGHDHGHGGGGGGDMMHHNHRSSRHEHDHGHEHLGSSPSPQSHHGRANSSGGLHSLTMPAGSGASVPAMVSAGNHEHARDSSDGPNGGADSHAEQQSLLGRSSSSLSQQLRVATPSSPTMHQPAALRQCLHTQREIARAARRCCFAPFCCSISACCCLAVMCCCCFVCVSSLFFFLSPAAAHFDQTATIGILVHSAIDGLALGAISVSDNSSLELVVFFAIIMHKAPAAFGLSSFLLHQGRERSEGRQQQQLQQKPQCTWRTLRVLGLLMRLLDRSLFPLCFGCIVCCALLQFASICCTSPWRPP